MRKKEITQRTLLCKKSQHIHRILIQELWYPHNFDQGILIFDENGNGRTAPDQ
jgi:hypothetical protein